MLGQMEKKGEKHNELRRKLLGTIHYTHGNLISTNTQLESNMRKILVECYL